MVQEWAKESPVTDAADEAEIDICSAVDIYINGQGRSVQQNCCKPQ